MRVELTAPIQTPRGNIDHIDMRDPKYADLIAVGMPATWIRLENGTGGFEQINETAIGEWIERLADVDPNFLPGLSLADSLALRDAVLDFFREAMAAKTLKHTIASSDSSSSNSDGIRRPSTI